MELWLLFGVLSYLSFALSSSIDKYFMNNKHNPVSTNAFKMLFDGIILLVVGYFFFDLHFTKNLLLWSLLLGALYAVAGIIYFNVLKLTDIEIVVPYSQSATLLLVFIGSVLLFNEIVNVWNYAGIVLILIGIYAVLSKDGLRIPKFDNVVILIFVKIMLLTAYYLLVKKVLFDVEPINLATTMYFVTAIFMFVYISFSKKQLQTFDAKSYKIIIAALFGAMGTLLLYSALSVGNASKVYPIAGLESVFVFIIASLFLKEKFQWHRLIGTIIVFGGIFLISL